MKVTIQPSKLKGNIQAPASKSSMQRACAAALLKGGKTVLHNPGKSDDDLAALDIIQQLGAIVEKEEDKIIIRSRGGVYPVGNEINCGESGLSVRMFTSIAALSDSLITVTGRGSLMKRPISFFNDIFPRLDVECRSSNGLLPLKIKGPLHPKNIEIDGSLSSQFLTGLLFAYAFAEASDVTIKVNNLNSKPYIDLTLQVLINFGLKVPANNNYKEFYFPGQSIGKINHASFNYTVEGDWSGGAFLLVAGAIAGPITVRGLDLTSTQADRAIIDALMLANAGIAIEAKGIKIHPSAMNAFNFDATDCPDLFPPLVALAAYCKGKSIIKGVSRLAHKESDRALTLKEEFDKIGVKIELPTGPGGKSDDMIVHGGGEIKGNKVHSHHDHRIAMAMAVAALKANGETIIEEAQAVKKSYPDFYNDLKTLGASVSLPYKFF